MCRDLGLKEKLIPRDVVTCWNSTYDMMRFVVEYRVAIDTITADKSLKMRRYELNNDDWKIIQDLVAVLEVCYSHLLIFETNTSFSSNTRRLCCSFHRIRLALQASYRLWIGWTTLWIPLRRQLITQRSLRPWYLHVRRLTVIIQWQISHLSITSQWVCYCVSISFCC